jgi:hypothetical protein
LTAISDVLPSLSQFFMSAPTFKREVMNHAQSLFIAIPHIMQQLGLA